MQAVDILPTPAAPSPERALPAATRRSPGAEQFHAVMGRALARSSPDAADDSGSPEKLRPRDRKSSPPKKSDPAAPGQPNPSACAEVPAAPAAPTAAGKLASGAPPQSQAGPLAAVTADEAAGPAGASNAAPTGDPGAKPSPADLGSLASTGQGQGQAVQKSDQPLAVDDQAADGKAAEEKPDVEPVVETGVRSAAQASDSETAGISGAKYPLPMQKAEKANEFSGSTEQNLPGGAAVAAGSLPDKVARPANAASQPDKSDVSPAASNISGTSTPTESVSAATIGSQWPSPARSLERAHDLMSLHAFRLRDSGQDALQVVIKPGGGLQLSLNLQMRDGNVEMQALLQRGNYEFLNLHWPELQQQLEARGVRLAPLEHNGQATTGDPNHPQQSGREQSPEYPANAGAFAGFALNSTLVPSPAPKARPAGARGWESWA